MKCPKCGSERYGPYVYSEGPEIEYWCLDCGYSEMVTLPMSPEYKQMIAELHKPLPEHLCPECGSEMESAVRAGDASESVRLTCFNCGHEETVEEAARHG